MFSAAGSYVNRAPWRPSGSMIAPPCRPTRDRVMHRGLIFFTVSIIVLVCGTIMTVLGFNNVMDSGFSMLGMLMVAVSVLLFFGGLRLYLRSRKMKESERNHQVSHGTVAAALVIEGDDTNRTLTVVMDTVSMETPYEQRSQDGSLPPDYTEATTISDIYPGSTGCIVIDDGEDPPPPYGPPTYEQAMSQDDSYLRNRHHAAVTHQDVTSALPERESTEQDGNTDTALEEEESESRQPVTYQDLPTVTI